MFLIKEESVSFWPLMLIVVGSMVLTALAISSGRVAARRGYSFRLGFLIGSLLPGLGLAICYWLPEI